ncbi:hypothetical protein WJX72_007707 [[Myrmecia] bisecta]|uniref:Uncharacterized protein n=1 Tax=[Myrmecia] bisecta TaxID=41462 RepID=A0AAW1QB01_9CHLO
MMTPEPILDIVRGLSTVASFGIVIKQLLNVWDLMYTGDCDNCNGTGRVTCTHCHGTKALRSRPGQLRIADLSISDVTGLDTHYPCIHCGPLTQYDFEDTVADDEGDAYSIMDNFQAALANRPRPHFMPILAGTQACPTCGGNPKIRLQRANFARLCGLEEPFFVKAAKRSPTYYIGEENRPQNRKRLFLEYPRQPPPADLSEILYSKDRIREVKTAGEDEHGEMLRGSDQLTMDDYILPYIDDSDTDDEEATR